MVSRNWSKRVTQAAEASDKRRGDDTVADAIGKLQSEKWHSIESASSGNMAGPMVVFDKPLDTAMLQTIESLPDTWQWQELAFSASKKNEPLIDMKSMRSPEMRQSVKDGLAQGNEYRLIMHTPQILDRLATEREAVQELSRLKWQKQETPNPFVSMSLEKADDILQATPESIVGRTRLAVVKEGDAAKLYIDQQAFNDVATEHALPSLAVHHPRVKASGSSSRVLH